MTVYIVQTLHWEYNDEVFVLTDDAPVKAFESRLDAETFCQEQEVVARQQWQGWLGQDNYIGEQGRGAQVEAFFEVIAMELEV